MCVSKLVGVSLPEFAPLCYQHSSLRCCDCGNCGGCCSVCLKRHLVWLGKVHISACVCVCE